VRLALVFCDLVRSHAGLLERGLKEIYPNGIPA
jgi:hypothetical protein